MAGTLPEPGFGPAAPAAAPRPSRCCCGGCGPRACWWCRPVCAAASDVPVAYGPVAEAAGAPAPGRAAAHGRAGAAGGVAPAAASVCLAAGQVVAARPVPAWDQNATVTVVCPAGPVVTRVSGGRGRKDQAVTGLVAVWVRTGHAPAPAPTPTPALAATAGSAGGRISGWAGGATWGRGWAVSGCGPRRRARPDPAAGRLARYRLPSRSHPGHRRRPCPGCESSCRPR